MEEWHQKLHNNTSPDDVVICEALIAYIDAGLDISAYWRTLEVSIYCSKQNPAAFLLSYSPSKPCQNSKLSP